MINWEKPHSEAFIEKHIRAVNWYTVSMHQRLSESFIEKYADKVSWWNVARCQDISAEFVLKHKERLKEARVRIDNYAAYVFLVFYQADGIPMNTREIPKKLPDVQVTKDAQVYKDPPSTSETDLERRKNMIDWTKPHTEAFIEKHIKSAEWGLIAEHQKLSERFIEKYASKLGWWYIAKYQDISAEFALRHKNKLKRAGVRVEDNGTYVRLYPYRDGCGIREIPKKLPDVQIIKDPPSISEINMDYIKDHAAELYNKYVTSSDTVNNPAHYQTHELECLVEMAYIFGEEALLHFAQCCAWKYRYRAGSKDSAEEDLKKSDFYTALARWLRQGGHIESFLKHRRKNS